MQFFFFSFVILALADFRFSNSIRESRTSILTDRYLNKPILDLIELHYTRDKWQTTNNNNVAAAAAAATNPLESVEGNYLHITFYSHPFSVYC